MSGVEFQFLAMPNVHFEMRVSSVYLEYEQFQPLDIISYYTQICGIRDLSGETDSYHPNNARVIRVSRAR